LISIIAFVVQEVKKEKVTTTAEPTRVRPSGGVGVSELRDKLGHMMMHPAPQHHAPTVPSGIMSFHSCLIISRLFLISVFASCTGGYDLM